MTREQRDALRKQIDAVLRERLRLNQPPSNGRGRPRGGFHISKPIS